LEQHLTSQILSQSVNAVQVYLSVVEIYCERIRDLLAPPGQNADNLAVLRNKLRGVFVAGATEIPVQSEDELILLMNSGLANRTVAATGMNSTSSRSHCVVSNNSNIQNRHSCRAGNIVFETLKPLMFRNVPCLPCIGLRDTVNVRD
jgi:Kinesin motor domain